MSRSYNGEEFSKALAEGSLRAFIVREGMAKQDPDDHKAFLFAEGDCTDWIKVPLAFVDEVTLLATVKCRDHEHPRVRIRFKEPEENPAAKLFAELARNTMPSATVVEAETMDGLVPDAVFRRRDTGGTTGGTGPLDPCRCLSHRLVCHIERIRIAPGKYLSFPVCKSECDIWECDPQ